MTVVFLHGLGRTHRSFKKLQRHVERAGLPTWARTYPSRRAGLADLARQVGDWLEADLPSGPTFAVTHSLGGLVLRHLTDRFAWRGAVLLAPPNAGSDLAARLGRHRWFRAYFGPAGQEVGRHGSSQAPDSPQAPAWPPAPSPFIVIAGTAGLTLTSPTSWLTRGLGWLPRAAPSDGTVLVDETHLDGALERHTVASGHATIMNHPEVIRLTLAFLEARRHAG